MRGKLKQRKMAATFYHLVPYSIWFVPAIANMEAPTVAELNAGVPLGRGIRHVAYQ